MGRGRTRTNDDETEDDEAAEDADVVRNAVHEGDASDDFCMLRRSGYLLVFLVRAATLTLLAAAIDCCCSCCPLGFLAATPRRGR